MINPLSIPTSAVESLVFKLNKRSTFANTAAAKIGASLASIILTQRLLSSIVGLGRISGLIAAINCEKIGKASGNFLLRFRSHSNKTYSDITN